GGQSGFTGGTSFTSATCQPAPCTRTLMPLLPTLGRAILLLAELHDLEAAVAEALLRIEVGDPELAIVRGDAQLDGLDAAPAALVDGVSQQARTETAPACRRLHPDLLDLGARAAAGRDADRGCGDGGVAREGEEPATGIAQDGL